jgi:hypothetical protein
MFTLLASMGTKDTVWIGYYVVKTVSDISLSLISLPTALGITSLTFCRREAFSSSGGKRILPPEMGSLPSVLPKGSVFSFRWEAYSPYGKGRVRSFFFADGKHRKSDPSVLPKGSIKSAILPFCRKEASSKTSSRSAEGKRFSFRWEACSLSGKEKSAMLPFCRWEAPSPSIKWDEWKSDDHGLRFGSNISLFWYKDRDPISLSFFAKYYCFLSYLKYVDAPSDWNSPSSNRRTNCSRSWSNG